VKDPVRALLVLLWALVVPATSFAGWEPPGWVVPPKPSDEGSANPLGLPLTWFVQVYRATVSRVDGDRCPSYPSCSAYALEAVAKHGPFLGAALTAGRLVSEADEAAFSPRIFVGGGWKVYAPVENDLAFLRGGPPP
jgi:hypothetical protein